MEKAPAKIQIELIKLQCNSILEAKYVTDGVLVPCRCRLWLAYSPGARTLDLGGLYDSRGGYGGGVFYIKHAVRF